MTARAISWSSRAASHAPSFFFHPAEDIFVNDDGVVNDDADSEDHGEHGDVVEREAQPFMT